ncbi:hypothetical protein HYV73_04625 [Candidatus Uhrbacteria bacterium]|nr:hypothetical protein [Candidatus Uhrbacteria bacterium]
MTENLVLDQQALFEEISERAQAEGVNNREAYNEYVEFVVMEKIDVGEESKDDDVTDIIDDLKKRWPEYEALLG